MSNEDEIRALIETWARAVSAGNRKGVYDCDHWKQPALQRLFAVRERTSF